MILVVPFNRLFQLRQRPQVLVAIKFLLALTAGQNKLALPGHRVSFRVVCHSGGLDADFLRFPSPLPLSKSGLLPMDTTPPPVSPIATCIQGDRDRQAAYEAWSAEAAHFARMFKESTHETEALRESF
jgi:hypothetical protein